MGESLKSSSRLPRIICILGIILSFLFSNLIYMMRYFGAAPAIEPQLVEKVGELFFHFSPTFIFTVILFVAWKWEYIGGIILIICGFVMFVISFTNLNLFSIAGVIPGIFSSIAGGMLFLRNHSEF